MDLGIEDAELANMGGKANATNRVSTTAVEKYFRVESRDRIIF
jgi:hypothetical protein